MATEIGAPAFPGGTWGDPAVNHIQGQLCVGAPAGTIAASKAWIRRDVAGGSCQVRMAAYSGDGLTRYGVSNIVTINDALVGAGTFVWTQHTFTWGTPGVLPGGDTILALHYGAGSLDLEMGATAGGGGGIDYDGYVFGSGAPATLTGGAVRTASFPISATVDTPAGAATAIPLLLS